jgi:hypothetical protein
MSSALEMEELTDQNLTAPRLGCRAALRFSINLVDSARALVLRNQFWVPLRTNTASHFRMSFQPLKLRNFSKLDVERERTS